MSWWTNSWVDTPHRLISSALSTPSTNWLRPTSPCASVARTASNSWKVSTSFSSTSAAACASGSRYRSCRRLSPWRCNLSTPKDAQRMLVFFPDRCLHACVRACVFACMFVWMCVFMVCSYVYVCMHACWCMCTCVCVCALFSMCLRMHIDVCLCVFVQQSVVIRWPRGAISSETMWRRPMRNIVF